MAKTYSVVQFYGSTVQSTASEGLPLQEASELAQRLSAASNSEESVAAVIDDESDEAIATEVYVRGKKVNPGLIRTIIFGLGRCM